MGPVLNFFRKIGISKNWTSKASQRLEKKNNIKLDDPLESKNRFAHPITGEKVLGDIHGDMLLEGRHGNNIRIGSRYVNPYIIISNNSFKFILHFYHFEKILLFSARF